MGHVRSKARSLGQILQKPCVSSRGQIFSPIIIKVCQNVCLNKISSEFENGSCWVKNKVTRSNLRKSLRMLLRSHFQWIIMKLGRNVCLKKISDELENGSCLVKNEVIR